MGYSTVSAKFTTTNQMIETDATGNPPDIQPLWDQGRQREAIDVLLASINAAAPARPRKLWLQFAYRLFLMGDMHSAERCLRELAQHHPDDADIIENLAVCLNRLHQYPEAVALCERACALRPHSSNAWDALTRGYSSLGNWQGAARAGAESLRLKDIAATPLSDWQLPTVAPSRFLAGRPLNNVIAFSLWGRNPRYLRGAMRNLLLIPELYPGWVARIYLDATVPAEFRTVAQGLGAELRLQPDAQSLRQRLCWRFLVANDPTVGRFLVRDCDSVVNTREVRAVGQWLASNQYFHVMRDWWTHTDLVLAGMWGGIAGVLPDLQRMIDLYRPATMDTATIDQQFLRERIWDGVRRSVLVHDRCYRSAHSQPWPDPTPDGNGHVGQDEFNAQRDRQQAWLAAWIDQYEWLRLPQHEPLRNAAARHIEAAVAPPAADTGGTHGAAGFAPDGSSGKP